MLQACRLVASAARALVSAAGYWAEISKGCLSLQQINLSRNLLLDFLSQCHSFKPDIFLQEFPQTEGGRGECIHLKIKQ